MKIEPYLYYQGRCDEALEFYTAAIGAKVEMLTRFRDMPGGPPGAGDKVMHASVRIGDATLLVSDGQSNGQPNFKGFALALSADNDAHAEAMFAALGAGGEVQMPMSSTPFASRFGMLNDKFGVQWTVVCDTTAQAA